MGSPIYWGYRGKKGPVALTSPIKVVFIYLFIYRALTTRVKLVVIAVLLCRSSVHGILISNSVSFVNFLTYYFYAE